MTPEGKGDKNDDCLGCRLVSGLGLLGTSVYIANHASKQKSDLLKSTASKSLGWSKKGGPLGMQIIAACFAGVGIARLLNIYPFNVTHKSFSE